MLQRRDWKCQNGKQLKWNRGMLWITNNPVFNWYLETIRIGNVLIFIGSDCPLLIILRISTFFLSDTFIEYKVEYKVVQTKIQSIFRTIKIFTNLKQSLCSPLINLKYIAGPFPLHYPLSCKNNEQHSGLYLNAVFENIF